MNPEIPLFPTRTIATRFSTARRAASAHMWVYTGAPNTPSLVMLSRKSAPCPAARRANSALDASKQIGTAKRTVRGRSEERRVGKGWRGGWGGVGERCGRVGGG